MFVVEYVSEKFFSKIGKYLAKLQARRWVSRVLFSSFSSVVARRNKWQHMQGVV